MKYLLQKRASFFAGLLILACLGVRAAIAEQAANAPATEGQTNPPVPPPAELQKLIATHEAYQILSPAEKARTARPVFTYPELSKTAAQEWSKALWQAWLERQTNASPRPLTGLGFPAGWVKSGKVVLGCVETDYWLAQEKKTKVLMRYGVLPYGEAPATGWPVYFNLHGGGPNPKDNDQGWAAAMGQYPIKQGLLVCPRAPVNSAGSWNDPRSAAALEKLLADLRARWPVDPNRIYLMGYSMGAIGSFHLGPLMPDRWAAVAGSSGFTYLGARGQAAADNLRNLPVMIQNGTKDLAFQRYPLAKAFAEAVQELHRADPDGYRVEFKEHRGRQHMIDDKDTPAWLSQFAREPRPQRIVWQQPLLPVPLGTEDWPKVLEKNYDFSGFLRQRCYWLRNDAPGAFQRLVVSRDGNTFRVEQACHVPKLTLLLDDKLADLDQPVVVVGGGRELARAKVPRTVTALVASLVEYGDPELMFCSEWTVPAPDSVAELEQQSPKTAAERRARAQNRMALKRFADAATDLEAALELEPKSAPALLRTLRPLYEAGNDTARLVSTLRRLAEALPDDATAQFEAAMMLLICEPESLRDNRAALPFAERAMDLTQGKNPQFARALGLAYFRNGQKDKAVEVVKAALALIPAGQLPNLRADLETALKTYSGEDDGRRPEELQQPNCKEGANRTSDAMETGDTNAPSTAPAVAGTSLSRRVETDCVVIHTDLPEAQARHYANFFDGFYRYFATNYFPVVQRQKLEILLFAANQDYQAFDRFGPPQSPFGYYLPGKNTMVVNVQRGLGTAAHELVHHFLALGGIDLMTKVRRASWVNEGIPEFFEKFMGYVADDGTLHISFGYFSNWRFPDAKEKIAHATLPKLFQEFDPNLSSAFMLFLHQKGLMRKFVRELQAQGRAADAENLLVALYGQPLAVIEREWKEWIDGQAVDDDVNLVPQAFVKTESEWRAWWEKNQDRLVWDEKQERYRPRGSKPVSAPAKAEVEKK